jgi:hypothetical protein
MEQLSLPLSTLRKPKLIDHPLWPFLKPLVKNYAAGQNRFEINRELAKCIIPLKDIQVPCAHCGKMIHPIRRRQAASTRANTGEWFVALTCPLSENLGCARGKKAREACKELAEALVDPLSKE